MNAGEKAYWFVWADQWLSLLCSDIGLFILAGESIKVSNPHQAAAGFNALLTSSISLSTAVLLFFSQFRKSCNFMHGIGKGL